MIAEKVAALAQAQIAAMVATLKGGKKGYGTPVTATIRAEQGSGLERSFRYAPFSSTVSAIAPAPQPRAAARVPFIRITDSKL